jgi:tetrahydromethanopterin:alpha-L-glutamate ligase
VLFRSRYGAAVLKPVFSTKARGMRLVKKGSGAVFELRRFREAGNPIFYVQRLMRLPGRDLGAVFLDGECVGVYAREAAPDAWNTTVRSGGSYRAYEPSAAVLETAHKAQEAFGLDFTTVDIIETVEGPQVLELSAFGGFRGLYDGCGVNAAELLADYVVTRVRTAT